MIVVYHAAGAYALARKRTPFHYQAASLTHPAMALQHNVSLPIVECF